MGTLLSLNWQHEHLARGRLKPQTRVDRRGRDREHSQQSAYLKGNLLCRLLLSRPPRISLVPLLDFSRPFLRPFIPPGLLFHDICFSRMISESSGYFVITVSCCGNDYWGYKQRADLSWGEADKPSLQGRFHTPRSQVTVGGTRGPRLATFLELLLSPGLVSDSSPAS